MSEEPSLKNDEKHKNFEGLESTMPAQKVANTMYTLVKFPLFCSVRCNPYCEVVVDGQRGNMSTEVLKKTTHPIWDEEFTL